MEFWLSWIELGVLFFIIEIFFLTFDFLVIGLSSLLTGGIVFYFDISMEQGLIPTVLFLLFSGFFIFLNRKFLFPRFAIYSYNDSLIGEKLIVKEIDGYNFVYHNGKYWSISFNEYEYINPGDTVEVLENRDTYLKVKKLF